MIGAIINPTIPPDIIPPIKVIINKIGDMFVFILVMYGLKNNSGGAYITIHDTMKNCNAKKGELVKYRYPESAISTMYPPNNGIIDPRNIKDASAKMFSNPYIQKIRDETSPTITAVKALPTKIPLSVVSRWLANRSKNGL